VRQLTWQSGEGNLEVSLDTVITPELQLEGNKRELIRTVNALRKEAGLTIEDQISIWVEGEDDALIWLSAAGEELKRATLSLSLNLGQTAEALAEKVLKLETGLLTVRIIRA